MSRFLFIMYASIVLLPFVSYSKDNLAYLAFGDLRGDIEPCGCDPKSNFGGIKRIASLVQKQKVMEPGTFVLNLGNNFFHLTDKDLNLDILINQKAVIKFINFLKPSASLFNELEMLQWNFISSYLKEEKENHQNFVLSNQDFFSKIDFKKLGVKKVIEKEDLLIFGFVEPKSKQKEALSQFVSFVKGLKSKKTKLALFSGSDEALSFLVNSDLFSEIISSNLLAFGEKEYEAGSGFEQKYLRNNNIKPVYFTPYASQGVLRGGVLKKQRLLTIKDLLKKEEESAKPSALFTPIYPMSWLDPSFDFDSPAEKILSWTEEQKKKLYLNSLSDKKKNLEKSSFAGAQACQSCHESAYKTWLNSRHAKALVTLEEKKKDFDQSCISCHVLGFHEKGGFVSKEISPQFAHVQCETCHGPRKEHIKNPTTKNKIIAKDVCVSCHHPPHSMMFDFKSYWEKIKH